MPLFCGLWLRRLGRSRAQLDDRFAAAGDDHLFAGKGAVDQLGKLVFGVGDAVGCHGGSPIDPVITIAIAEMSVHRPDLQIGEAGKGDLAEVRRLLRAYASSLPFSLEYQGFAEELAGLPAPYAPPEGCLLLARSAGAAVGVVGLKPLSVGIAEIKRLYVVPEWRGAGVGQMLARRAVASAEAKGYQRVRLDTHRPTMAGAMALYRALGFREIPPYGPNPGGEIAFFEKQL